MAPKLTASLLVGGEVEEPPLDVLEGVVFGEPLDEIDAEVEVAVLELATDDADEAKED